MEQLEHVLDTPERVVGTLERSLERLGVLFDTPVKNSKPLKIGAFRNVNEFLTVYVSSTIDFLARFFGSE